MMGSDAMDETPARGLLESAVGGPAEAAVARSRRRVAGWFAGAAPRIAWDVFDSPLGPFYLAASQRGICRVAFGPALSPQAFLETLDPLARTERDPEALAGAIRALRAYFERPAQVRVDLPVDLSAVTPFHRRALELVRRIPAGTVWTYQQVAETLGKPRASRAVGQALARNPVPVVVPCHRVVGSGGALTGYGGGGGIATKRRLLQWEGAL